MLTSINEERGQVAAQRRGRVVNGEDSVWQPHVPVVLAAIGEGQQRVTQHAIDPLYLGVGVFVVGGADEEARADAPRELLEQRARELGVVVHDQHVGDPVTGAEGRLEDDPCGGGRRVGRARWYRMDLTGEVIDVHLHLVEARRRHGEAQQPVHPDHTAPARGKREGME